MKSIYLITAIHIGDPLWQWGILCVSHRCTVGWFSTLESAEKVVIGNLENIHVHKCCGYDHCVIEEVPCGLYPHTLQEKWFEWVADQYLPVNKPLALKKTVSFGMG